jgi:hypothetical protein
MSLRVPSDAALRPLSLRAAAGAMCRTARTRLGASAVADAALLASHNRSVRLVERIQWGWRELEPWHDTPAVKNVRDRMLSYRVA